MNRTRKKRTIDKSPPDAGKWKYCIRGAIVAHDGTAAADTGDAGERDDAKRSGGSIEAHRLPTGLRTPEAKTPSSP